MSDLRAIWRSTRLLAALGHVVAGIRDSCSGCADFRPWLLSAQPQREGNAKTRVDERSKRDWAFYLALAALGLVVAGIRDSCSGYAGFRPWLLSARPRRQENAKTRVDERSTRRFGGQKTGRLPVFWPRWALSWRESGIAVPATPVSSLGCFPRGRGARETPKRA